MKLKNPLVVVLNDPFWGVLRVDTIRPMVAWLVSGFVVFFGWFQIFFIFTPKIGEDEPILTHIFEMG